MFMDENYRVKTTTSRHKPPASCALLIQWAAVLVLLGAISTQALAADRVHFIEESISELSLHADVLEDPGGNFDLAEIRARDAEFRSVEENKLPQSKSTWWLRVRLAAEPGLRRDWVLIAGIPALLDIRLYAPTSDGYRVFHSGAVVPQSLRALPSWEPRFPIQLGDTVQTLYLRVHDPAELSLPLILLDPATLEHRDSERMVWMGLFLGLMLGLLVYNLFLYLILRDPAYGWYVLSGSTLLLCFLVITGWGSLYLWPETNGFEVRARIFLPALWGVAYWRFIAQFFSLQLNYPRLNRLLMVFSGLFVLIALWSLTGERFYSSKALHLLAIVALPCVFLIGILRWRDGFRPAAAILLGQLALISPIFTMALRVSDLIGPSPLIDNGLLLGAAAETLLFAVALALRIRDSEIARDGAQRLLFAERQARLEQIESHNIDLEQRVFDRTAELEKANAESKELARGVTIALNDTKNAGQTKIRFLAAASHDLRQPIHTLTLLIAALGLRPLDNKAREIASSMANATATLAEQLDALLDISKLDAGVLAVTKSDFSLFNLLTNLQGEISTFAAGRSIQVELNCPREANVRSDRVLLERIIRNLVTNAISHNFDCTLRLNVEKREQSWQLSISDSGKGVAEQEHSRIFEEFYQLDNPERDRSRGLGLGLAIVRRLESLLELNMTFSSSPGEGTRFGFTLPHGNSSESAQKATNKADETLAGLTVLVVDDEAAVRDSMQILLEELGCTVMTADGTESALALARHNEPDTALVDFRLRGEDDGLNCISQLRQLQPTLPAILVTGETAKERLREAASAGVEVLNKPLMLETLKQAIIEAVEARAR